jgi:lambda family phage tail tape measure protein
MNLGTLLVELGVNTAAFKKGMDAATYQAKQTAKEMGDAFSGIGDSLRQLGGQFGEIGNEIGNVAGGISDMIGKFADLEAPAAVIGGIVAAFAGAGIGALGAAVHFSETAAKLHDLSQATGVAVEDLSLLGNVAATKGIDVESFSKGLEKMDKAALQAAQSGPHASNAFKDLGISVTTADGSMREAKDIFDDVAKRFETMPDGPQKTAEAIKIFGRAGAQLIPILNEGGGKLQEMEDHFKKLNSVVSDQTAAASVEFQDTLSIMGEAFKGVENTLTAELVPALIVAAKEFVAFFEDNQAGIQAFVTGIGEIAKVFINVFQVIGAILSDFFNAFLDVVQGMQTSFTSLGNTSYDILHGNFSAAFQDIKKGAVDVKDGVVANFNQMVSDIKSQGSNIGKVWEAALPPAQKRPSGGGGDINKGADVSFIDKSVQALERQADKEAILAQSIGLVTQATIDATAAATANEAIQKLKDEAEDKGIANTRAFKDALAAAIPRIQEATQWQAAFKAELDAQKEFDNFDKKLQQQVKSLQDSAQASTVVERQWAKNAATLQPLQQAVGALSEEYEQLALSPGTNPTKLKEYGDKLVSLTQQLNAEKDSVNELNAAFQQQQAQLEAKKLDEQIVKLKGDLDSLRNGDAFMNIGQQADYMRNIVGLTTAQIDALLPKMQQIRQLQVASALNKKEQSLGFDPAAMATVGAEIQQLKADWEATKIPEAEYERTMALLLKEQADLAAQTGGFASGVKAAFADFTASVQTSGQTMQKVIGEGLKGISDDLTTMVMTGKAKWSDLIASMESALLKSSLNSLISGIFGALNSSDKFGGMFGGSLFGGGGLFGGGHALGGSVVPGMSYLVGEKGPEIFTPSNPGSIAANGSSPAMGNTTVHQHITINTPNADSFRKSQAQVLSDMQLAGIAAVRHNR